MHDAFEPRGILDVIRTLAARGATGRLHLSTGMTEGALFFARGQLVDARLGKLTGFQAINALVSVPDASYDFDPAIAPPVESSIAPNERVLLKDFFGIDVAEDAHSNDVPDGWFEADAPPERVVPLAEIAPEYSAEPSLLLREDDEATLVRPRRGAGEPIVNATQPPLRYRPAARSRLVPALLLLLVTAIVAAAAIALFNRMRRSESTASVAPAAQTSTPANVAQQPDATAAVPDLNGNWNVVNTVEQTAYEPYRNMEIGFNVAINQAGRDFTGTGEKISENGRNLNSSGRTAIQVKGTIDGDQVHATFSENGASRKTNGQFVWRIDKGAGGLTGTFVSTAARTSGKSTARKL